MAERVFSIRTEPHRAVIGDVTLLLVPEADSGKFLDAYTNLQATQSLLKSGKARKASSSKHAKGDAEHVDTETLAKLNSVMREFVTKFLMPESLDVFRDMHLPDRILLELIEFAGELYGGGSGNPDADGGTSSD